MSTVRIVAIAHTHRAIRSFVAMVVVLTLTVVSITDAFSVTAPFQYETRHSWLSPLVATTTMHSRTRVFVTPADNEEDPTSAVLPPPPSTTTTATNTNSFNDLSPTEFILATEQMDPTTRAVVEAARKKQQQLLRDGDDDNNNAERSYPIDLPSPVLLATSMIFAIISTGSLFQLFDNAPKDVASASTFHLGVVPTAIVVLMGAPLSIFLLYAAITKATAETEADDKAFLSGK